MKSPGAESAFKLPECSQVRNIPMVSIYQCFKNPFRNCTPFCFCANTRYPVEDCTALPNHQPDTPYSSLPITATAPSTSSTGSPPEDTRVAAGDGVRRQMGQRLGSRSDPKIGAAESSQEAGQTGSGQGRRHQDGGGTGSRPSVRTAPGTRTFSTRLP